MDQTYMRKKPANSWLFRLSTCAFILLFIPILAQITHGIIGTVIILSVALFAGVLEGSIPSAANQVAQGVFRNPLVTLLLLWYFIGLCISLYIHDGGLSNWRLMTTPMFIFLGTLYTYAYWGDEVCFRQFRIGFTLAMGVQCLLALPSLLASPGIVRVMQVDIQGQWAYGNVGSFSIFALLLPLLVFYAWEEKGILRIILFCCDVAAIVVILISSLATPVLLMLFSLGMFFVIGFILPIYKRRRWLLLLAAGVFLLLGSYCYEITRDDIYFASFYYRVENLINDPTSGGYSGADMALSRYDLDRISIQSFLTEPVFGVGGSLYNNTNLGGHSSLFDFLGAYGLLGGGGAFILFMMLLFLSSIRQLVQCWNSVAMLNLIVIVTLVLAGIVNPFWNGMTPLAALLFVNANRSAEDKKRSATFLPIYHSVSV
jgi:hypothetical protein